MPPRPLDDLIVLDLTRVLSGPYCTMLLGDMGARIIKVEQPGRGDETRAWGPPFVGGESTYFLSVNRNKESLTLDFKQPDGRRILDALIARADILVENFRPGALARLGLDYGALRDAHPRLIYCSISGYGQTGPRRHQAGYDAVMQAEGGLMSVTGDATPFRMGVAIADMVAGLLAAQGITLALLARSRAGTGQHVDVGMMDGVLSLLTYQASAFLNAGTPPRRMGNRHPTIAPYDTFPAADGFFFLAVGNDSQFRRLCDVVGGPELADDPRFATNPARVTNEALLRARLEPLLQTQPVTSWIAALTAAGVPCGAVRSIPDALADPQTSAREMVATLEHVTAGLVSVLGLPIKLSDTPGGIRTAPPTLGQHTIPVLHELGETEVTIEALRQAGAI